MRTVIHEMRNHLAVATAQIEAMMEGKMIATPARLKTVLNALTELDVLMSDLGSGDVPPTDHRPA
jgi:hypothetical protein